MDRPAFQRPHRSVLTGLTRLRPIGTQGGDVASAEQAGHRVGVDGQHFPEADAEVVGRRGRGGGRALRPGGLQARGARLLGGGAGRLARL